MPSVMMPPSNVSLEARARQSRGASTDAIYRMAAAALSRRHIGGNVIVDVGCGSGAFWSFVNQRFASYRGVDAIAYPGFPAEGRFHRIDLNEGRLPFPDATADVAVAIETIEHLENPRAVVREMVRVVRAGGWVVVTTPNQLSLRSVLALIVRHQFAAFQDVDYPAHITALLEIDLRRIAAECGLGDVEVEYSGAGRIVFVPWTYPAWCVRRFPRALSDNLLVIGRKATSP